MKLTDEEKKCKRCQRKCKYVFCGVRCLRIFIGSRTRKRITTRNRRSVEKYTENSIEQVRKDIGAHQ